MSRKINQKEACSNWSGNTRHNFEMFGLVLNARKMEILVEII